MTNLSVPRQTYNDLIVEYEKIDDVYKGETTIKRAGTKYLLPSQSYLKDNAETLKDLNRKGELAFERYKYYAHFPSHFEDAVDSAVGILNRKMPEFKNIPSQLEPLIEDATGRGEPMALFARKIHFALLTHGFGGVFLDLPSEESTETQPYLSLINAKNLINWGDDGRFAVIKHAVRNTDFDEFEHKYLDNYTVLRLLDVNGREIYHLGKFETATYDDSNMVALEANSRVLENELPFIFCNVMDIDPSQRDDPPLMKICDLAIRQYGVSADLGFANHQVSHGGTLVLEGDLNRKSGGKVRTGPNHWIHMQQGSKANYVYANPQSVGQLEKAIERMEKKAAQLGGQLISQSPGESESGSALRTRIEARTITLKNIALTAGIAMEDILKKYARWIGLPEAVVEAIEVLPNVEFTEVPKIGQEANFIADSIMKGAFITRRAQYERYKELGMYTNQSFEEVLAEWRQDQEERNLSEAL